MPCCIFSSVLENIDDPQLLRKLDKTLRRDPTVKVLASVTKGKNIKQAVMANYELASFDSKVKALLVVAEEKTEEKDAKTIKSKLVSLFQKVGAESKAALTFFFSYAYQMLKAAAKKGPSAVKKALATLVKGFSMLGSLAKKISAAPAKAKEVLVKAKGKAKKAYQSLVTRIYNLIQKHPYTANPFYFIIRIVGKLASAVALGSAFVLLLASVFTKSPSARVKKLKTLFSPETVAAVVASLGFRKLVKDISKVGVRKDVLKELEEEKQAA